MPNPIYPGGIWYPGSNAGYNAGRNEMRAVVCHYTVGRNSLDLCARDGLCQFVISRGGDTPNSPNGRATVWQLAETDATCWHAGAPFNQYGPGLEAEYYDEWPMFTDDQIRAMGDLCLWLSAEWGIPLHYFDTGGDNNARVWDFDGFLSHRACQSSADWHYDYWTYEDWDRMIGGPTIVPPPIPLEIVTGEAVIATAVDNTGRVFLFVVGTDNEVYCKWNDPERPTDFGVPGAYASLGGHVREP